MTKTYEPRSLWQSPVFTLLAVTALVTAVFVVPVFAALLIFAFWGPVSPAHCAAYELLLAVNTLVTLGLLGFGFKQAASRNTVSALILIAGLFFAGVLTVTDPNREWSKEECSSVEFAEERH